MQITIQPLNEQNIHDLNRCDGTFIVDALLILHTENGHLRYTITPVSPYKKRYLHSEIDPSLWIRHPDDQQATFFAYLDTQLDRQLAGQIILLKNWNGYAYIEDIAVDANCRQRGIGRVLIQQAMEWAKAKQLPGIMLETQNNNVAACLFYQRCGFELGGFDKYLYQALHPGTEEIALYWYLKF
jgi:streptothricin acetyltransferase